MKNRLLKIAEDTSFILEIYKGAELNEITFEQKSKFCGLCNDTLRAQKKLAYDLLIIKGEVKRAHSLNMRKSCISDVVKIIDKELIELKESLGLKFPNKYINQF